MSNILGEGFNQQILNQINTRQLIKGSSQRVGTILTNTYSKTGWCKLMSSVKIVTPSLLNNPDVASLNLVDNNLAKQFVLFNGTREYNNPNMPSGIANSNNPLSYNAYGMGGTQQGLRPMPGITSVDIESLKNGTLETSTVKIKAFNKTQFDIIDVLYMRLGFSVLLEWGHSNYYLSTPSPTFLDTDLSLESNFFGNKFKSYTDVLNAIETQRYASEGNYDALFGRIVNFSWTFNRDGSYDITIIIRSVGDVIESFKMNTINQVSSNSDSDSVNSTDNSNDIITAHKNSNNVGIFFDKILSGVFDEINQQNIEKNNLLIGTIKNA